MQKKQRLWSQVGQQMVRELPPGRARRRDDLLHLMAMPDQQIERLDRALPEEAQRDKMARLLQTRPRVGAITALARADHGRCRPFPPAVSKAPITWA